MQKGRARRLSLVAMAVASLATLAAPVQAGADMTMSGKALVRLVDLSSDSQAADFYIDGTKAWSNVAFKTVSNYIEVSAEHHAYEVRRAGSAADSPPLARVEQTPQPNSYYSVMTAGWFDELKASVFNDGSSAMPTPDICQARFINAVPDLASINITVRGLDARFSNLGFMSASQYGNLPKGVYDVEMRDSHDKVIASVKNYVAPGGHMHSLAAAGGVGRPVELVEFYDAMTAEGVPQGAAHTGAGGASLTSALAGALPVLPFALLASVLVLTGLPRIKP